MTDYCDTPEEVAKNPHARAWMAHAANGDEQAFHLMWRFWCFSHLLDDLIDGDCTATHEVIAREWLQFMATLSFNQFWIAHAEALFPVVTQAVSQWIDGDEWARSVDPETRAMARVLRSADISFYAQVAFITGGWDHMRSLKGMRSPDAGDPFDQEA